jgi:exopolyphosphatase/guanosine-5'-triphosphate,3'-diphosphate pyrophosphatase
VDRTRELAAPARARTLACLADYAKDLERHAPERIVAVGTSAMRDARGGPAFAKEAEGILGVLPLVIDGEREAALTFRGTLSGLGLGGRIAVFDVGGGSTELVVGELSRSRVAPTIDGAKSVDVGSVRLFERHVRSDPPSASEIAAVEADVDRALAALPEVPDDATLVGVAGTVTTLAAIAAELEPYDGARIHGSRLALDEVREVTLRLLRLPLAERRKLRGLEPRRADVIVTGALLVERFVRWARKPGIVVSDRGVRWGLAEELAFG